MSEHTTSNQTAPPTATRNPPHPATPRPGHRSIAVELPQEHNQSMTPPADASQTSTTNPESLPAQITQPRARLESELAQAVNALNLPTSLTSAIRYAALAPGKRLRPLLLWHTYHAALAKLTSNQSTPENNLQTPWLGQGAAAAIELIHAFSLVHDDLPGLDDDDLRRGRPTLHRRTSVAMAVLAGDAMLTGAFQTISSAYAKQPTLALALTEELSTATNAMIAGQVFDTLGFEDQPDQHTLTDLQKLEQIHRNKTGALISAACRMGVLCAIAQTNNQTSKQTNQQTQTHPLLAAFSDYANHIGLMFQIVDDLLDVTQSTEHLGKKSGKDADAGKLTYPNVLGVLRSRHEVDRLQNLAIQSLADFGPPAEPLRALCRYMAVRTR